MYEKFRFSMNGLMYFLLWSMFNFNVTCACDMQIPHGNVFCWSGLQSCSYSCYEGYKKHKEVHGLECSTSRQWVAWFWNRPVSAEDLCTPMPCPTVISKGAFSGACPAVVGSTCSFSCEAGYMRNTFVSELTCQTSTEWSADLRSLCLRPDGQQCPYYIPRGYLNPTCIREPGQICNFTCDKGYQPAISPSKIACGSNLKWNHNPASLCQGSVGQQCPYYIPRGYLNPTCIREPGQICNFTCDEGYQPSISPSTIACGSNLKWNLNPASLCQGPDGQQCPYYIPRGYLNPTCIREPGQICNFTCDEGYQSSISPSKIACGSNSEWNHNPASMCQEIICPKSFEGGYVSESCSRKYKATCYDYQCNPGYIKYASNHYVICGESGEWIYYYYILPACINSSSLTFRTTPPAATTSTSLIPTFEQTYSYNGQAYVAAIVGFIAPSVILIIILIIVCIVWKAKRARKSQSVLGRASGTCLRPRENRDQNVTTLRQQPNADGINSASSFESPSSNGIYVHSFEQRISSISSSCKYYEPPPSYTENQIAANEAPPTYTEVVRDPTRFNLYI